MSADRTNAWAERYSSLLREYISLMGGNNISAVRKAQAEQLATLGVELSQLTDRFAAGGRGASSADLALYLKLGSDISERLQSAGLSSSQPPPVSSAGDDDGIKTITTALKNIMHQHVEERAEGLFRDASGNIITDPLDLELEKQIHALMQRRGHLHDAPAPLLLSPPSTAPREAEPVASTPTLAAPAKAPAPSTPAAKTQAAEAAGRRAMEPMFPAPPASSGPTSTEFVYESGGGGRPWWGPV